MQQILMAGGIGRMESVYRDTAKSLGFDLIYCVAPLARACRPSRARYARAYFLLAPAILVDGAQRI